MIRSLSLDNMHEEPEILFSGFVKKLSRNFRIWQHRILTLNALGDIYITKISNRESVTFSSCSMHHKHSNKPPINITHEEISLRQGEESDGKWPSKLDLRQSLVLETAYPKFIFLTSIRAAEALKTQIRILQLRQKAKGNDMRDLSFKRRDGIKKKDIPVQKEEVKHIVHSMLNLTELGKFAENVKNQLIEKSESVQSQEEGDKSSSEVSLDFEVRENLVSCKVSHSLEDITKIEDKAHMSPVLKKQNQTEPNEFKPKPILKKQDFFSYKSKKRVRFDSAQAFRISTSANPRSVQLDWQNVILPNFYRQVRKHSFDAVNVI